MDPQRPITLRKGKYHIYISYASTGTNNLLAQPAGIQLGETPEFTLGLDCNLRVRDKQGWDYVDAMELAEGGLKKLEYIQIHEDQVLKGVFERLDRIKTLDWSLKIQLIGEHMIQLTVSK